MHRACTNNPLKSDRRKLDDMAGKTNIDEFFLCPCKKQLFHLTKSAIIQIAKTVQCIEPVDTEDLGKVLMQLKTGVVVLGLATSHNEEWKLKQVRGVDQTPYPSQLHGASLATAMQRPCRPLLSKKFYIFTDGSHTHPPAGGWENKVPTMRWKWRRREMKMRWRWQWDESYLTRTQRGERKRRGKEKTPTHET